MLEHAAEKAGVKSGETAKQVLFKHWVSDLGNKCRYMYDFAWLVVRPARGAEIREDIEHTRHSLIPLRWITAETREGIRCEGSLEIISDGAGYVWEVLWSDDDCWTRASERNIGD